MNRREMILRTAPRAGLGLAGWNLTAAAQPKTKKVLFFSKSSGFEHSVIKRKDGEPSFAETFSRSLVPNTD